MNKEKFEATAREAARSHQGMHGPPQFVKGALWAYDYAKAEMAEKDALIEEMAKRLKVYGADWDESVELPESPALPKGGVQRRWAILRNEDNGQAAREALALYEKSNESES